MALLGSVIKLALETIDTLSTENKTAFEKQNTQLQNLLNTAKDTAFGKYYGFSEILNSNNYIKEFQASVPIHTYKEINKKWWLQQQKKTDITWPSKPDFFAVSSGTTGKKSKHIPITNDFITNTRKVGISMLKSLANFELADEVFEKEIFMLSSSANLKTHEYGFKTGEISGINVTNFPDWYDTFYRPGKEIAAITDWDERLEKIAEEAPNWDVGAIAGIPSWILEVLKAIIKKHNLKNIHEIWPHFSLYSSGGVAFETYRKSFENICGKKIQVLDTYLASEGFIAYTARPNTMNMKLALEHNMFFEFIPFNQYGFDENGNLLKNPKVNTINEVEENKEYALVLTTSAGAWRYMIGDTIKFVNLEKEEIVLTGRTKFFLNVVGSQLSEEKLDNAIVKLSKELHLEINEYIVGAIQKNDSYRHQWILVSDTTTDTNICASYLDKVLKKANKNYSVARSKALESIHVKVISKQQYHAFLNYKKKKGGQIKTPKVMKEKDLLKMMSFLDKTYAKSIK